MNAEQIRAEQERVLTRATDAVNEMLRGKLWLHVKTGGVYLEYGRGDTVFDKKAGDRLFSGIMGAPLIEATDDIPAGEMFVRYRNVLTGEGWARPARLFDDGRFIPLTLAPAAHAEALAERERLRALGAELKAGELETERLKAEIDHAWEALEAHRDSTGRLFTNPVTESLHLAALEAEAAISRHYDHLRVIRREITAAVKALTTQEAHNE